MSLNELPPPMILITILGLLALVPFVVVMATSFVKFAIVFSLLRNALGVQQIPPNIAIYGLSIILTIYIMAPIGFSIYEYANSNEIKLTEAKSIERFLDDGLATYRDFLRKYSSESQYDFFQSTASKIWPPDFASRLDHDSLLILLPSFTISELKRAFEIGFLIYLPFIAIDLIISNVLLALGMMMMSPVTISLPFKLLLFVLIDGWSKLTHGLIAGYT